MGSYDISIGYVHAHDLGEAYETTPFVLRPAAAPYGGLIISASCTDAHHLSIVLRDRFQMQTSTIIAVLSVERYRIIWTIILNVCDASIEASSIVSCPSRDKGGRHTLSLG